MSVSDVKGPAGVEKARRDLGSPRAWIEKKARDVVQAHLETRDRVDFARSVKSMTDHTTHEYGGRFLLELIQNAYDAHPAGQRDGRIAVVLDETEGAHGVLYVSNTGNGFSESNARAICNLGLSDKPVGEGIGNKGVGFKSVLQICELPEIHSSAPRQVSGPGFSFRFAQPHDIEELVDGDLALAAVVEAEISFYSIPVWLDDRAETVERLLDQGYATVIRLPLRSHIALTETRARLAELLTDPAPVLLFLRRIELLTVEHLTAEARSVQEMRRLAEEVSWEGAHAERVLLSHGKDFLVFSKQVPAHRLHAAIVQGVEAEVLDRRWLELNAPAEVSVAVPDGHDLSQFRCYTYLPMGPETASPFAGHLNAPFFTNLSRRGLDLDHPLNALLMAVAAEIAVTAAEHLAAIRDPGWEAIVADLMSWSPSRAHCLQTAATSDGVPLLERLLIPSGRASCPVATPAQAVFWPLSDADVLTGELAADVAGLAPVSDSLGEDRAGRLDATLKALGCSVGLEPEELASAVEQMAAHCLQAEMSLSNWDLLYDDLACLFEKYPSALASRRVLLADDHTLRPCAGAAGVSRTRRRQTPFFPPVRQRTDDEEEVDADLDVSPPAALRDRIFYLHHGLSWYDENREQTRARRFFQSSRLVHRFEVRTLLEQLRPILEDSRSPRLHRQALQFVYALRRTAVSGRTDLAALGLRVPNQHGDWILAAEGLFSSDWSTSHGRDVSLLATAPAELAPELAGLAKRVIGSPTSFATSLGAMPSWRDFLQVVGVQDGLPVYSIQDTREIHGRRLTRTELCRVASVPEAVVDQWSTGIVSVGAAYAPETPYVAMSPVYWLPGQAEVEHLGQETRSAYARLVVAHLGQWPAGYFSTTWERNRSGYRDPHHITTPLAAFLARAEWVELQQREREGRRFVHAKDAWYFPTNTGEAPPRFAPLMSNELRGTIADDQQALDRLKEAGIGLWHHAEHAYRLLGLLGRVMHEGRVDGAFLWQFHRAYRDAWANSLLRSWPSAHPLPFLVVEQDGQTRALPADQLAGGAPVVVVNSGDDHFESRLVRELGQPLLEVSSGASQVSQRLAAALDGRITCLADHGVDLLVDGRQLTATGEGERLAELVHWLPRLFAVVLEHRWPNATALSERNYQDSLDRFSRVRVVRASAISVRSGDVEQPLPSRLRGIVPVADQEHPTIVVAGHRELEWPLLDDLPEPLMQTVGHRILASELALAMMRLRALGVDAWAGPAVEDLAEACAITRPQVERTLQRVEASVQPVLRRLFPFLYLWCGADVASQFTPNEAAIATEDRLVDAVAIHAGALPMSVEQLVKQARTSSDLDELRRAVAVTLSDLNSVLTVLDGYEAIDYGQQHAEEFGLYVRAHWTSLTDRLRWASLTTFEAGTPIDGWAQISRATALTPDPTWGTTLDQVPEELMAARVEQELARILGAPAPETGPALAPMPDIQRANIRLLDDHYATISRSVRAWCTKTTVTPPKGWDDPSDPRPIRDVLVRSGALDFRQLSLDELVNWLSATEQWPTAMPVLLDNGRLGLAESDLDKADSEEARAARERQKARRTVHVNGDGVDVGSGYTELLSLLESSLGARPEQLKSRARFAKLETLTPAVPGGPRSGPALGARPGPGAQARASQVQTAAIGFAGEWIAHQWLGALHGEMYSDDCWVSTNRAYAFSGDPGDDGKGYDFLVPARGGPLMYEVKATTGDPGQIILGESEVRLAQQNARNERWRLLIIAHVLDDNREVLMLPNPFGTRHRGQFVFAGEGLRLRFRPSA